MAFLSLFRKNRPQPNPTESDLEAAKRAADESFKMYGRKIGRGVTAFGNTTQNPRIRYNTPEQEAALPQPGMVPMGAENLQPSEQNPMRTLSVEGQARANAAPLGTSSRWANMRDFYAVGRPSYGDITDAGTGKVRQMTAGEYAASIGRGSRLGIARFNRNQNQVQAERMFNTGQEAMVKASENQAMGQMLRSLNVGDGGGDPVQDPTTGLWGQNTYSGFKPFPGTLQETVAQSRTNAKEKYVLKPTSIEKAMASLSPKDISFNANGYAVEPNSGKVIVWNEKTETLEMRDENNIGMATPVTQAMWKAKRKEMLRNRSRSRGVGAFVAQPDGAQDNEAKRQMIRDANPNASDAELQPLFDKYGL